MTASEPRRTIAREMARIAYIFKRRFFATELARHDRNADAQRDHARRYVLVAGTRKIAVVVVWGEPALKKQGEIGGFL